MVIENIIKGIFLSVLYFEITKTNDTTAQNIFYFTLFYVIMIYSAILFNIDPNLVTNAFITKTIFTLVDERIKKPKEIENKLDTN